jgi:hypothetical protein
MKPRDIAKEMGFEAGCYDNSCLWGSPGVGTNGGCRCADKGADPVELRRDLQKALKVVRYLDEKLSAPDAEKSHRMDNPLAALSATEWKRRHDGLADRLADLRDWAQSRARYCETVLVQHAVPSRDIPLEPVERRGELTALKAVLAMIDGKEVP